MKWRKPKDPIRASAPKQPATLKMAVATNLRLYPASEIKVHAVGRRWVRCAGYIALPVAADHIDRIEEYIRNEFGGGDFRLAFYDPAGTEIGSYMVGVEGPSKFKDLDGTPTAKTSGGDGNFLKEIGAESLKNALNPAEQMKSLAEAMKAMQPPPGDGDSFQKEIFSVMLNNWFTNKENEVDKVKELMEMARMLQPTVTPEDPMTAMVAAFAPLLGQLLMSRGGGAGGVQQALGNPQLQQAISAAQNQNAGPGLHEPGDTSTPLPAVPSQDPDAAIIDAALIRFREHIQQGTHVDRLTQMFLNMIALAGTWKPDHEMFAPFLVDEDWTVLSDAFDAFCLKIPELAGNKTIQDDIKVRIVARMLGQDGEDEPEEEVTPIADTDNQPGPQVIARPEPDHDDSAETSGTISPAVGSN